jgi:hypothetical protein
MIAAVPLGCFGGGEDDAADDKRAALRAGEQGRFVETWIDAPAIGEALDVGVQAPRGVAGTIRIEPLHAADDDAPEAGPGDVVTLYFFAATDTTDGPSVYDSSDERERPLQLRIDDPGLSIGLRAGLERISTGEVRRVFVPYRLGYGERGRPPIPPATDLVFVVHAAELTPASETSEGDGGE